MTTLLQGSDTADFTTTDDYPITLVDGTVYATPTITTARKFWRLRIEKEGAGQQIEIGRLFLGPYTTITRKLSQDGFNQTTVDPSIRQESDGGQEYTDIRDQFREFALSWRAVADAELDTLEDIYKAVGIHTPWFVWIQGVLETPAYVKYQEDLDPNLRPASGGLYWDVDADLREQR